MEFSFLLVVLPVVLLAVLLPVTVNGHGLRVMLLVYFFSEVPSSLSGRPVDELSGAIDRVNLYTPKTDAPAPKPLPGSNKPPKP